MSKQHKVVVVAGQERQASKLRAKPVTGFFAGLLGGGAVMPLGMLTAMLVPFIGLPLMLIAALAPFFGLTARGTKCPSCDEPLLWTSEHMTCPGCHHPLVRRGRWVVDVAS